MKTKYRILNVTKDGVCQTITAHYHKEGVSNIIGGGSSIVLATAVIEYEEDTRQTDRGDNLQGEILPILGGGEYR